ncbi:MAG: hypothetical protein ACFFHD_05070 [Promethearchaeota archaeon]
MHHNKKKPKKILSVLFFIFSCLPIAFIFILLRYIPKTLPLLEAYINSGSSFFIPIIPNINLLPEKGQLIGLTLGQLIDIIIMVEIFGFIEISMYHFFKKKYSNEQFNEFGCLGLNYLPRGDLSSQEQEDLFGLEVDILYSLNNSGFDQDFVKTFNINEEDLLFYYFHILEQNRKRKNNKRFYKKSKFVSYYYNKNSVSSLYLLFKIKNFYLKNIYSLLIINLPTIFNENTRGGELTIDKTSINYFYENYLQLKFKIKSMSNSKLNFKKK